MKKGKRTESYYAVARPSGRLSENKTDLYGPLYTLEEAEGYQRNLGGHIVQVTKTETWEPVPKSSPNDLSAASPCPLTIDPTDPEVIAICSILCFQCGTIAARLRQSGHDIAKKVEDEQGKVILWLLGRYAAHGADWPAKTDEELSAMGHPAKPEPDQQ